MASHSGSWLDREKGTPWVEKWKMGPNPKHHILYDPPSVKCPVQANHINRGSSAVARGWGRGEKGE